MRRPFIFHKRPLSASTPCYHTPKTGNKKLPSCITHHKLGIFSSSQLVWHHTPCHGPEVSHLQLPSQTARCQPTNVSSRVHESRDGSRLDSTRVRGPGLHASSTRAAAAAGEAADDDVEEGDDGVDDGFADRGDGVNNRHDAVANGPEDGLDL